MKTSKAALAAVLAIGGTATLVPAGPADALQYEQRQQQQTQQQPAPQQQRQQRRQPAIPNVSREENTALLPLYQAVQASDWAAANAALPAAQAGVQSPYARYLVGQLMLAIGRGTQNTQVQAQAVDAMVASGGAPAEVLPQLLSVQAGVAIDSNNLAAAVAPLTRLIELNPNDVTRISQLAQIRVRLNQRPEALTLYRRALQLSEASGQTAPEDLYRRTLAVAYEGRLLQPSIELTRSLLGHYATPTNWRDSLLIYRELANVDGSLDLDVRRLMRAAQALTSERDYVELAELLARGGLPGEVKAVLEEGISRNVLRANQPDVARLLGAANGAAAADRATLASLRTQALAAANGRAARSSGDAYFAYGQYAEAAELYRAALQKGGEDANLVNTRLGAALALGGQRAEAEAAFRAVTGPRAELANYWLLWLSRRA